MLSHITLDSIGTGKNTRFSDFAAGESEIDLVRIRFDPFEVPVELERHFC